MQCCSRRLVADWPCRSGSRLTRTSCSAWSSSRSTDRKKKKENATSGSGLKRCCLFKMIDTALVVMTRRCYCCFDHSFFFFWNLHSNRRTFSSQAAASLWKQRAEGKTDWGMLGEHGVLSGNKIGQINRNRWGERKWRPATRSTGRIRVCCGVCGRHAISGSAMIHTPDPMLALAFVRVSLFSHTSLLLYKLLPAREPE